MRQNTNNNTSISAQLLRISIISALALLLFGLAASAQDTSDINRRLAALEQALAEERAERRTRDSITNLSARYVPQLHGILRGKYEYEHDLEASRFEVRNARLSVSGALPLRSEYKLEVDLCDESVIKMKDAWVRVLPWRTLRVSVGQQRLPFSIDAHRNPSAQYFANRSFIAKQVGDMRDVGAQAGYTFADKRGRTVASIDAGLFNGSNLDNEKLAWHDDWNYSARLQLFPTSHIALVPSIQHTAIADHRVHYTSVDMGAYYEAGGLHVEAEYLHKHYDNNSFDACQAVNAMAIWKQPLRSPHSYFESISYLARYDWMDDHSDGKKGFDETAPTRLLISDYARHRMTLGMTFAVRNRWFPTDLRLNYERYWYGRGGVPKQSEQDKLVAEIMIKF